MKVIFHQSSDCSQFYSNYVNLLSQYADTKFLQDFPLNVYIYICICICIHTFLKGLFHLKCLTLQRHPSITAFCTCSFFTSVYFTKTG